jgi:hypothetical protein
LILQVSVIIYFIVRSVSSFEAVGDDTPDQRKQRIKDVGESERRKESLMDLYYRNYGIKPNAPTMGAAAPAPPPPAAVQQPQRSTSLNDLMKARQKSEDPFVVESALSNTTAATTSEGLDPWTAAALAQAQTLTERRQTMLDLSSNAVKAAEEARANVEAYGLEDNVERAEIERIRRDDMLAVKDKVKADREARDQESKALKMEDEGVVGSGSGDGLVRRKRIIGTAVAAFGAVIVPAIAWGVRKVARV